MLKRNIKYYSNYCCGCGLCASKNNTVLLYTDDFIEPKLTKSDIEFCSKYCPSAAQLDFSKWNGNVWGNFVGRYLGFSSDDKIRYRASSGGTLTSIAKYLLESGLVNGIIHSVEDPEFPWRTKTVCTKNSKDLINTCGSRYAQSSPLADLFELIDNKGKYAFVGKPCDCLALKGYMNEHKSLKKRILFCLTFFCAGIPSEKANVKLIKELGFDTNTCKSLSYRGKGWPGYATVYGSNGISNSMDYNSSWGKILGRDIRKMCKFCMVGTGEVSDIVCGDAWYLGEDGYPDFGERDGRNIILARTEIGNELVLNAYKSGYIKLEKYQDNPTLEKMNPYQYERKATQIEKVLAMKFFLKKCPNDSIVLLLSLKHQISFKRKWEVFKGTVGRILKKRI